MKRLLSFICLVFTLQQGLTQNLSQGSLRQKILAMPDDTAKVKMLYNFSSWFPYDNPDSAFLYSDSIINLSSRLNYSFGLAFGYVLKSEAAYYKGDYMQSLILSSRSIDVSNQAGSWSFANFLGVGRSLVEFGDTIEGVKMARRGWANIDKLGETAYFRLKEEMRSTAEIKMNTNYIYAKILMSAGLLDSALFYALKAYHQDLKIRRERWAAHNVLLGTIYYQKGDYANSLYYYNLPIDLDIAGVDSADILLGKAEVFQKLGDRDSCLYFARLGLFIAQKAPFPRQIIKATALLSWLFEDSSPKESIQYLRANLAVRDTIDNKEKLNQLNGYKLGEQLKAVEVAAAITATRNRFKIWTLAGAMVAFLAIAVLFWRNSFHRKKSNILLHREKQKVENAYRELQATQAIMIQREKMASLGELTAGIAHEIQNPLNFVNNFSEVNKELIDELRVERLKAEGERNKDLEDQLLSDISQNLEKINQHGKRADGIVKGMLQHSKAGTGQAELTDLNSLADEYLRLSYHGMRAKNKLFNAEIHTDFDTGVGEINIVPQDIGRVLVNLYNNAFYAIGERFKVKGLGYEPAVSISTKKNGDRIEIRVADNGSGIPQTIKDKIFQPFFTTKPTGQGTGLGLSLSYDIVKAHGGEIIVESKEGEGSEFIVQLPIV